jgi:hypothetical protein
MYQDQRCLALFIKEILCHKSQFLHTTPRLGMTRTITSYFHADPSDQSNKRRVESQSTLDSRLVRPRSPHPLAQGDRTSSSIPIRKCRMAHQSIHSLRVRGISSKHLQSREYLVQSNHLPVSDELLEFYLEFLSFGLKC